MQSVRATARRVTETYETALKPTGLTASQFTTLVAVALAKKPAISTLAERLHMDRTTLTRVVKPLERRGFVAVVFDKDDKRLRRLELTDAGRDILTRAEQLWNEAQSKVLDKLGQDNWASMQMDLSKL